MTNEPFLNARRRRDYPRLMFIAVWLVMGLNLVFHQGWIGAFGQVIGGDFIVFYRTGLIYRTNPDLIYDFETQCETQQALVFPTLIPGCNPFENPPFVALLYSGLTYIQLGWSYILWSILAIASVFLSAFFLIRFMSSQLNKTDKSYIQIVIITLSFFPFVEGLIAGQNHWLTLLLTVLIVYCMLKEKWFLSGIFAGLLIYKPQFVIGFLIIWLVWGKIKSLIAFSAVSALWIGVFIIKNDLGLFNTYSQLSQAYLNLPYISGFPNYLLVTFYGFLTSIFPQSTVTYTFFLTLIIFVILAIALGLFAYMLRNKAINSKIPAIVFALLLPLLATPYALLHDMIILIPVFVLWGIYYQTVRYVNISMLVYIGAFILTLLGTITKFDWLPLITMGLFIALIAWIWSNRIQLFKKSSIL